MSFVFGGNSGISAEEAKIQRLKEAEHRRRIAEKLMTGRAPQTFGAGLNAIGQALAYRMMNKRDQPKQDQGGAPHTSKRPPNKEGLRAVMESRFAAGPGVHKALERGAPNYRYGTKFAQGGEAVVGEDGPERVILPRGAQVLPNPQTAQMAYDPYQDKPSENPAAHQQWLQQQIDQMSPEQLQQLQGYDPASQQRMINDPSAIQPPPMDMRENLPFDQSALPGANYPQKGHSFDDQRSYQTADASQAFQGAAQQFNGSEDNVIFRDLSKREIAARGALNNLQMIADEIEANPEVLNSTHTLTGRMRSGALAMRDRLGIDAFDISDDQAEQVGDTAAYRQKLLTSVNLYIKEITGAQVGQGQETTRLMAVQPNESDSPAQLTAKLKSALEIARMEVARINVMRQTGGENAPTDKELRSFLMERGRAYYEEAVSGGADPTQARLNAAKRMSEEFGF